MTRPALLRGSPVLRTPLKPYRSIGVEVPIAAAALGATIVEKHVTLARFDGGPNAAFSLEPAELAALVHGMRAAWRSLYVARNVASGEILTDDNVRSIWPGFGLHLKYLLKIVGNARGTRWRAAHRYFRRGGDQQ